MKLNLFLHNQKTVWMQFQKGKNRGKADILLA